MTRAEPDIGPSIPAHHEARPRRDPVDGPDGRRLAIAFCLIGLALSWLLAALSEGVHQDDDLTHFLFAKWAAQRPSYLLHTWGRPGFTVLYFLPAQLGWTAARAFSGLLTVLAAWFAYCTAERMRLPWAWAVVPLALIQPMFGQLSYTTLTETPMAFYVALACYLLTTRRYGWSAAVLSLTLVTRHEGVVWLPIWVMALWLGRARWTSYLWLIWAPLVHNVLHLLILDEAPLMMFLAPKANLEYGHGTLLAMPARALLTFGPGMLALGALGVPLICRRRGGWVIAALAVALFGFHTMCRYLGLYATGGYPRFLVPICPLVAILVLAGIRGLGDWSQRRWWIRPAIVAAAAVFFWCAGEYERPPWICPKFLWALRIVSVSTVVLALGCVWVRLERPHLQWVRWVLPVLLVGVTGWHAGYVNRPYRFSPAQVAVRSLVQWLQDHGYGDRRRLATHVWVNYWWPTKIRPEDWHVKRVLSQAPTGTVLIWDRNYSSTQQHGLRLKDYLTDPNFRLLTQSRDGKDVFCYAFEKVSP